MIKKASIVAVAVLLALQCLAQAPTLQDLEQKVQKAKNITERIEARNLFLKKLAATAPQAAITYGLKTVELATESKSQKLLADAFHHVGAAYQLAGDYRSAAKYNYKALGIREVIGDSLGICTTYNNIGNINNYLKFYDKALGMYEKSLLIAQRIKNKEAISRALNNIGYAYQIQNQLEKSISYYKQALPIKEEIGDKVGVSVSAINLGGLYIKLGQLKEAKLYLQQGLSVAQEIDHQLNVGYAYRGLAEAFQKERKYAKAQQYALQSLAISKKQNSYFEIIQSAEVLNGILVEAGEMAKAHEYMALASAYKDSLHEENAKRQVEELQVKYEAEKKEKENQKLTADRDLQVTRLKHQENITYLAYALIFSLSALAYVLFRGKGQFRRLSKTLAQKNKEITLASEALQLQAEDLQKQKALLEKSNKIKDRLFSIVAHDLRSPLVSLNSLLQLLRLDALSGVSKGELLDKIETEQENALWLMDNLFVWAKSQMEGAGINAGSVDLFALAQENLRLLQPQANKKLIAIQSAVLPETLAFADAEMVKLVLRNLLSNAIKFCRPGDKISLSATVDSNFVTVAVKDSGVGIPEERKGKIFSELSFSTRGTADEVGSGLGLHLCQNFVILNGGNIWVESEEGKGSEFYFTLPIVANATQKQKLQEPAAVFEL